MRRTYSTVTPTRLQVKRGERSAIRMVLSSAGLCYDAVRPCSDFVNDADEAIERLLCGEEIWLAQRGALVTAVQRAIEEMISE